MSDKCATHLNDRVSIARVGRKKILPMCHIRSIQDPWDISVRTHDWGIDTWLIRRDSAGGIILTQRPNDSCRTLQILGRVFVFRAKLVRRRGGDVIFLVTEGDSISCWVGRVEDGSFWNVGECVHRKVFAWGVSMLATWSVPGKKERMTYNWGRGKWSAG